MNNLLHNTSTFSLVKQLRTIVKEKQQIKRSPSKLSKYNKFSAPSSKNIIVYTFLFFFLGAGLSLLFVIIFNQIFHFTSILELYNLSTTLPQIALPQVFAYIIKI